jgi:hypothetical protein
MSSETMIFPNIFIKDDFSNHLCQGDIIQGTFLKRFIAVTTIEPPPPEGFIILSNTCDLKHSNIDFILFSPIFKVELFIKGFIQKLQDKGKNPTEKTLIEDISKSIYRLTNYGTKGHFFLPPDDIFEHLATFSILTQIYPVERDKMQLLLDSRTASLIPPWREKLGYCTGYLFNRVATYSPDKDKVSDWYENEYSEFIKEVMPKEWKK